MGGNNSSENLVRLTAREHFIAHRLLVRIYPDNHGLKCAVWRMCNGNTKNRNYGATSRVYEHVKVERAEHLSLLLKGKPTHRYPSAATRAKMSAKRKGKKRPPEATKGIKNARLGKPMSEEAKIKLSNFNKGKVVSEETKAKMRAAKRKKLDSQPSKLLKPNKIKIKNTFGNCLCKFCNISFSKTTSFQKICTECAVPRPCKCGCGGLVKTPGKYFKHKHDKQNIPKYNSICKFCNKNYYAGSATGRICEECAKPKKCKCGCNQLVNTPGWDYKPNHNKELRSSFLYSCMCKFCDQEYLAGSSTGKICSECATPRLCKCGCGSIIKLPGKYFRSIQCKLYFQNKIDK